MTLSARLRPDVECAPWVIEAVKKLELALQELTAAAEPFADRTPEAQREKWSCHYGITTVAGCARCQRELRLVAALAAPEVGTPAARWRADGTPDPHGALYDCERAKLAMGDLTDDELANAVFLYGDARPNMADVIAGKARLPGVYLSAAKDRIRWLSRQLDRLTNKEQQQ